MKFLNFRTLLARRGASLRGQLRRVNWLVMSLQLAVATIVLLAVQTMAIYVAALSRLDAVSGIIAANSTAALEFSDSRQAVQILAALSADEGISAARLIKNDGQTLAEHLRVGATALDVDASWAKAALSKKSSAYRIGLTRVDYLAPVFFSGDLIGHVYLVNQLAGAYRAMLGSVLPILMMILAAWFAVVLYADRLMRKIVEPIRGLAGLTRLISENKDFSSRAPALAPGQDARELVQLSAGFNAMLEALQEHDVKLNAALDEARSARNAAELANRMKSSFLAVVSHEIRTPMNGVLGMNELLLETRLSNEQRGFAETALKSGKALLTVIDDLLDFSKIEAGRLDLVEEDFNLRDVVEDTIGFFAEPAQTKGLELCASIDNGELPSGDLVRGDEKRLRQILTNLIANAVKFTEVGEVSVTVQVKEAAPTDDAAAALSLSITVRDTGVGIPPEQQEAVFEAFRQADSRTSRLYGGTGLGLSIVRQLCRLMHGDVTLVAPPAGGSEFICHLRMNKPSAAPQFDFERNEVLPLRGRRVLVVDDNAMVRDALCRMLRHWKLDAVAAASGEEALALLSSAVLDGRPFDIALIDMLMPSLDGLTLVQAMRSDVALVGVAVILLSALGGAALGEQARQADIAQILVKPVRMGYLRAALVQLTAHGRVQTAAQQDEATHKDTLGARVLLIEDNPVNQEVARAMLERIGCKVEVAADGAAGVALALDHTHDLILMDCYMPGMDGFEATRQIRAAEEEHAKTHAQGRHVPIIAVTADAMSGITERCRDAGMDDFLVKPFNRIQLREKLKLWVEQAAAVRATQPTAISTPGIDQEILNSLRESGGEAMVRRLVRLFIDSAQFKIDEMRAAAQRGDASEIFLGAHFLKSSAANLGLNNFVVQARAVEARARSGESDQLADAVAQLDDACQQMKPVLEALCAEPEAHEEVAHEVPPKTQTDNLLVVDDDPVIRALARHWLGMAGFAVTEAENGEEACALIERTLPDIVLLDVNMPLMNGYFAARRIRSLPGCQTLPIVMLTALGDRKSVRMAFEFGATDYITKPVNWALTGYRLRRLLKSANNESALWVSRARHRALLNVLPDAMLHFDANGRIVEHFHAPGLLLDMPDGAGGDLKHCSYSDVFPEETWDEVAEALAAARVSDETQMLVFSRQTKGRAEHAATRRDYEARFTRVGGGEILTLIRDITERRARAELLSQATPVDSLSAVTNRQMLARLGERLISEAQRTRFALAYLVMDIDHFKRINDTLGTSIGNQVLEEIGKRVVSALRCGDAVSRIAYDRDENAAQSADLAGHAARLGGDEFAICLPSLQANLDAGLVAQRMLELLREPLMVQGHLVSVSASIGISIYPTDAPDIESLMQLAEIAMFETKRKGRDAYRFYSAQLNESSHRRLEIVGHLRHALERNEFELYYQPQVDLASNAIVGCEALLRWRNSHLGFVNPDEFIQIAEETGLIDGIGVWVLENACAQARSWLDAGHSLKSLAVNVSARQLRRAEFSADVARALDLAGLPPTFLELEIIESVLREDLETARSAMFNLKELGVRIAVEDFGMGYSSLYYLAQLPLDVIKIDRSLVRGSTGTEKIGRLVRAIASMATSLGLDIIAEGAETKAEREALARHGCQVVQGFVESPPLPAAAIGRLLQEREQADLTSLESS